MDGWMDGWMDIFIDRQIYSVRLAFTNVHDTCTRCAQTAFSCVSRIYEFMNEPWFMHA